MHPILVELGRLQIRSYGFMLAVSFLLGIWLAGRRAKRAGIDPQKILDLSVIIILAAVVGSRLLYVVFHLEQYRNPLDIFALWQGGATFYGGFLLAMAASSRTIPVDENHVRFPKCDTIERWDDAPTLKTCF